MYAIIHGVTVIGLTKNPGVKHVNVLRLVVIPAELDVQLGWVYNKATGEFLPGSYAEYIKELNEH